MIYYTSNQIFQLFIVGSFFISIKVFFTQYFSSVAAYSSMFYTHDQITGFFQRGGFAEAFSFVYIGLLIFTVTVSLGSVIDKGIFYFKIIGFIFSILTILSLFGIAVFLIDTGFYPEEKHLKAGTTDEWIGTGIHHFSWITLCGSIMLCVYILPMIMRPFDFLQNFTNYVVGMITYVLMLPTFINVM